MLALAVAATATAAGPGSGYRNKAAQLQVEAQKLDTRAHKALLDLYALDSRLGQARTRLTTLAALSARLHAREAVLAEQLAAAQRSLAVSQQQLGDHLRSLYEEGTPDPLAVVLGAQSLDEAISKLDDLSRIAEQSRQVVEVTRSAQSRLERTRATLARQRRKLNASLAAARGAERDLATAHAQRVAFVGSLHDQQQLKEAQIRGLLATARAVEQKSQKIQAAASASPSDGAAVPPPSAAALPAPSEGGRTLIVSATGYSLPGHTATGLPVGWGIVAVDPTLIPLGTRMTIPGYGEGVAADVGSAVKGATIDLWFPTLAQALAWGRRTVTITLH